MLLAVTACNCQFKLVRIGIQMLAYIRGGETREYEIFD